MSISKKFNKNIKIKEFCESKTLIGKPCKNTKFKMNVFCKRHLKNTTTLISLPESLILLPSEEIGKELCELKTKKGTLCKNQNFEMNVLCENHLSKTKTVSYKIESCKNPKNGKRLCKINECDFCFKKSFASSIKAQYWSEDKNGDINPRDVSISNGKNFWFKCGECFHDFNAPIYSLKAGNWCPFCSNQKLCKNECDFCFKKSFASSIKAQYWSENKNGDINPRDVSISNGKNFWFKCGECFHDFNAKLSNITTGKWCPFCSHQKSCKNECDFCFKKSFASSIKAQYWSKDKNDDINPRNVSLSCNKNFWFKCGECFHDFNAKLCSITAGNWCPFCSHQKSCKNECDFCFKKSFASSIKAQYWSKDKNGDINPRDVSLSCNEFFWFKCGECFHDFNAKLSSITAGNWCSFCSNQKLCKNKCNFCFKKSFASSKKAQFLSKDKNGDINPRDVSLSCNEIFWFKCGECFHDFYASLCNIKAGKWCPYCINKTEKKIYDFLKSTRHHTVIQAKFDWCKSKTTGRHKKFDFYLEEYNIIIELDGCQHFRQVSNWKSPEETIKNDVEKMKCALENNISVIRITQIDVFNDIYDWKKFILDNLCKKYKPEIIYKCSKNRYENAHKNFTITSKN